jgi:hypothetical protein
MNKEELKQKAKDWCKSKNLTPSNVGYFTSDYCEQSYIAGATEATKELEAQIEKMKCDLLELRSDSYDTGMYLRVDELIQKWEIKEK